MLDILVEKLLVYGETKLNLNSEDITYYRNVLLNKFGLTKPYMGVINISEVKAMQSAEPLIDELNEALRQDKRFDGANYESIIIDILGMLTPIPSVVTHRFKTIYAKDKVKATDYLYDLSVANNYIQKAKIDQNIKWRADFEHDYLEMTINLAKPEKDNKEVAKLLAPETDEKYPSCLLCVENVGFGGNAETPPRQNLRAIPLKLDSEDWYLQYSPFVYFEKHCIVISEEHKPMSITPRIFSKLLAFTDQFPHFFVGSNSDLPIVGGSILNHEHFQAGALVMPMFKVKDRVVIKHKLDHKVKISILDWYSSVVKIQGKSKALVLETASKITEKWISYENANLEIIPFTGETRHNTVTPIAVKQKSSYILYLVMRNNRTNAQYPTGIFHAHPEYHNIKKEGIGLIEQMGTFILPGRLKGEFELIINAFTNKTPLDQLLKDEPKLTIHKSLIDELAKLPNQTNSEGYNKEARLYMNEVCRNILINTAVFKNNEEGNAEFIKFLK